MTIIRYLLAIGLFISGIACMARFFLMGFDWLFAVLSIICFLLAYWLLPKQRRQQHNRHLDGLDIIDILIELPIELMFNIIILPFRLLRGLVHLLDGI